MSGKVVVDLNGGIGNQLWGWAAGYALASRLGLDLSLDCRNLHQRKFQLGKVSSGATVHRSGVLNYLPGVQTVGRWLEDILRPRPQVFEEETFAFDPRFRAIDGPVRLKGYFQSPKYFEDVQGEIRSRITTPESLARVRQMLDRLSVPENFLAVHVRLGDYVSSRDIFPALGPSYYFSAIARTRKVSGDLPIVCFTDSLVQSQQLLPDAALYIGPETISSPLDNLIAMSRARAFVGSNSSFSWWASYLLEDSAASRVFPEKWFANPTINTEELVLPGWTTL